MTYNYLNIFEIAPNLSYLKLVCDRGWAGGGGGRQPITAPLSWVHYADENPFVGLFLVFNQSLFLQSDLARAVIELAQVYSPLVRVRC